MKVIIFRGANTFNGLSGKSEKDQLFKPPLIKFKTLKVEFKAFQHSSIRDYEGMGNPF